MFEQSSMYTAYGTTAYGTTAYGTTAYCNLPGTLLEIRLSYH